MRTALRILIGIVLLPVLIPAALGFLLAPGLIFVAGWEENPKD